MMSSWLQLIGLHRGRRAWFQWSDVVRYGRSMESQERRYRMKWAIITVGSALITVVGLYASLIFSWSGAGLSGD